MGPANRLYQIAKRSFIKSDQSGGGGGGSLIPGLFSGSSQLRDGGGVVCCCFNRGYRTIVSKSIIVEVVKNYLLDVFRCEFIFII